ncbi:MFS general substrate transporter [Punctularia strigosozonata HHB-11173 SS5]|uniref:MFS general substrate transporter n=1 Tax=Punctularia strigosozonata (strain HHB-11173) TaxID=741275 RepID=UPI0004417491|nr:MFS general substrate transporter [Punctularia strigosozonata HHB-11173 SS5]EIN12476.1 MFS general substrate transporter [Punctularia strigosozonata HHB-11173 SS5]
MDPTSTRASSIQSVGLEPVPPTATPSLTIKAEKSPITKADIEHAPVLDDPRKWSRARKTSILFVISFASAIAGLGTSFPAIQQIEKQLHASAGQISLSLSLFILVQGGAPLFWAAMSEIKGRKMIYIVAIALNLVGCICVATAKTIQLVIGMRVVQAAGSSAVMAIGAATLADIYEPSERGTMMGIYYTAPLLGPSLGPIIGGLLTQFFNWRATFWFMVIFAGLNLLSFVFIFKDTFRRERSLTYQQVLRRLEQERSAASTAANSKRASQVTLSPVKRLDEITLSLKDVNPIGPVFMVLRRLNNFTILFASGLIFSFSYSISYTCARTLGNKYDFDALKIGLTLLAYGIGSIAGSIFGGNHSDRTLARMKALNGGRSAPEMRLASTKLGLLGLPPATIAYAWIAQERVHVAAVCVTLFFCGFFSIWVYSSTLAYLVDANAGRSSTAVAANSFYRGLFAFIAAEVAVPLQNAIGDGGLYTLWAGLTVLTAFLILLVLWKGGQWREAAEKREARSP